MLLVRTPDETKTDKGNAVKLLTQLNFLLIRFQSFNNSLLLLFEKQLTKIHTINSGESRLK